MDIGITMKVFEAMKRFVLMCTCKEPECPREFVKEGNVYFER